MTTQACDKKMGIKNTKHQWSHALVNHLHEIIFTQLHTIYLKIQKVVIISKGIPPYKHESLYNMIVL